MNIRDVFKSKKERCRIGFDAWPEPGLPEKKAARFRTEGTNLAEAVAVFSKTLAEAPFRAKKASFILRYLCFTVPLQSNIIIINGICYFKK